MPNNLEDFQKGLAELCVKHGYPYYFAAVGEPADSQGKGTNYYYVGNHLSAGLADALEHEAESVRQRAG